MQANKELKWQKLLWSLVIIVASTLVAYRRFMESSRILGFGVYLYVVRPYLIGFSLLIILLRLWGARSLAGSFIYIFTGATNAFMGLVGIYLLLTSQISLSFATRAMFFFHTLLAVFVLGDVFIKKLSK
jgi:hypothetical protein